MKAPDNKRNAPGREGRKYCVYKHTLPDGRYYIGATYRGEKRWGKDGCHYKNNKDFYALIKRYGWNNIKHEILFSSLSSSQVREIERRLISETMPSGLSLNKRSGGYYSVYKEKMHEIVGLRKIGLSYPEISKMYDIHPDGAAAIVKHRRYLIYYSEEEFAEKVALFVSKNKNRFKRHDGLTPNHNGHLSKRVLKKDKDGNIIGRYESITMAAKENNVLISSIANNLKGLSKLCGGYKYEYE